MAAKQAVSMRVVCLPPPPSNHCLSSLSLPPLKRQETRVLPNRHFAFAARLSLHCVRSSSEAKGLNLRLWRFDGFRSAAGTTASAVRQAAAFGSGAADSRARSYVWLGR
jgi:hypothetical protein